MTDFEKGQYGQPIVRAIITLKNVPAEYQTIWVEDEYEDVVERRKKASSLQRGAIEVSRIMPISESNPMTIVVENIVTISPGT